MGRLSYVECYPLVGLPLGRQGKEGGGPRLQWESITPQLLEDQWAVTSIARSLPGFLTFALDNSDLWNKVMPSGPRRVEVVFADAGRISAPSPRRHMGLWASWDQGQDGRTDGHGPDRRQW